MDLLAFFGMPLISVLSAAIGYLPYAAWVAARSPSRYARCAAAGAYAAVVGYAGAVLYGLAFTHPAQVCGRRTLDDDFPLVRATVNAFPPSLTCYWTDSETHGPSHPTALGTWLMWAGIAAVVVGVAGVLVVRESRAGRRVRAGVIWSAVVAVVVWAVRIRPVMALSVADLHNACFRWQVEHISSAPRGDIVGVDRTVLPLSVTCSYTDGTVDLIGVESLIVYLCAAVFAVCAGVMVHQVRSRRA